MNSTYIRPEVIITKVEKHHHSLKGAINKNSSSRVRHANIENNNDELQSDIQNETSNDTKLNRYNRGAIDQNLPSTGFQETIDNKKNKDG